MCTVSRKRDTKSTQAETAATLVCAGSYHGHCFIWLWPFRCFCDALVLPLWRWCSELDETNSSDSTPFFTVLWAVDSHCVLSFSNSVSLCLTPKDLERYFKGTGLLFCITALGAAILMPLLGTWAGMDREVGASWRHGKTLKTVCILSSGQIDSDGHLRTCYQLNTLKRSRFCFAQDLVNDYHWILWFVFLLGNYCKFLLRTAPEWRS